MATEGSVYQRRKDGRWVAQYRDISGKVRYLYRKTKAEAKQALREALTDRDNGIVPPSKMTLEIYLDGWMNDRRNTVSPRSYVNQESIIRRHVKPHIGSQKLASLSSKDIQSLYHWKLSEGLTASTIKQIHSLLNQALREALYYERLTPSRTPHHLSHVLSTLRTSTDLPYALALMRSPTTRESPFGYPPLTVLSALFLLLHYSGVQNVKKLMRPTPPSKVADLKKTNRPLDAQVALSDL